MLAKHNKVTYYSGVTKDQVIMWQSQQEAISTFMLLNQVKT
jgi:hypothetical protein